MDELLRIEQLTVTDKTDNSVLLHPCTLRLRPFRTLGIVGESGSGKSLLAKAIMGLLPDTLQPHGQIGFQQQNLLSLTAGQYQALRGKEISLIMQNAMGAFDPLMSLKLQFVETLRFHTPLSDEQCYRLACDGLEQVGLKQSELLLSRLPHQLSGGQLQRMMIALALVLKPSLIIADEPTTALDALTQSEMLKTFRALAVRQQSTLIFISHDLGLVRDIADDIAVMQQGRIVEYQPTDALWHAPQHPYTRFLLETRARLSARFQAIMAGGPRAA